MLLRMSEPQGGLTERSSSSPCAYMGISGTGNRRKGYGLTRALMKERLPGGEGSRFEL